VGAASKAWCRRSLPARPIEKGRPGPGLLAHVVSSKYADHLRLYRLEQIFERHGVQITRRTRSEWNGAVADCYAGANWLAPPRG
jgi:transposase